MRRPIARDQNQRKRVPGSSVSSWLNFTPSSIPNLGAWFDASDISTITESGGAVSQWNDKSGNGRNVSQSVGSSQPTTGATTLKGYNVIDFDGSADHLFNTSPFMWSAGAATICCVLKGSAVTGATIIAEGSSTSTNPVYRKYASAVDTDEIVLQIRQDTGSSITADSNTNNAALDNTFHASVLIDTGNQYTVFIDRVRGNDIGYTRTTTLTANRFALGCLLRASAGNFFTGSIAEICVYSRALTLNEKALIDTYFKQKWATP